MIDDPRVDRLLEELLDSGSSPEEACRACPELLPQVRARLLRVRLLEQEVGALFPSSDPSGDVGPAAPAAAGLPRIPGYEVEGELGRGGVGIVYRARHLRLDRTVALKMLLAGPFARPAERERFLREAQALAALSHPNIVQVHEVAELDGQPYFTMEYVEGDSLAAKLSGTPLPPREAAGLAATLAGAVEAAHRGGIVHRDLKPANVLLAADGTPKVTDFGLARRLLAGAGLTQTGFQVGTPSYMAPEQARGQTRAVGPAADVYALGAILYETLTGRPPFRAETPTETVHQVIYQDPAPPSRLNAKVPRELETICLKCLHKEPERRYASSAALAADLNRFREGRPILARPPSLVGRLWRWARRNPAAAALVATALALVGLAVGGGFWLQRQQAERHAETARREGRESKAAEAVLEEAADLERHGRWPQALAVLEGAPSLVDTAALADLRERVDRALEDARMVTRLEELRLRLPEGSESVGHRLYAETFREYGVALPEPEVAAARIRNSAIRETLLAFLHDWLFFCVLRADLDKLRVVLDRADDDDWRRRLRKTLAGPYDLGKRQELFRAREAPDQPALILGGLARMTTHGDEGVDARALVLEAQQSDPEDFWINYQLGFILLEESPRDAVGYFRAAVASRPDSSQARIMLGRALHDAGDTDAAIVAFRRAISLPSSNGAVARELARALAPRGGLEEARALWEKALEGAPPDHDPWLGYAQLCAFLGNEEAYRRARQDLLERPRDSTHYYAFAERDSMACLLLPASAEELRRAVALVDWAVAAGPKFFPEHAYNLFIRGLAEYRQGRLRQAVPLLQESAALLPNRPGPRLVLAMAQFRSGFPAEARRTLAAAVRIYNWMGAQAVYFMAWVNHVLRREAEAMILPNLPAFLRGEYEPQDNDERLALMGICQAQGRYRAAARLYAAAFTADPDLADTLTTECRYRSTREEPDYGRVESLNTEARYLAARCAALAGCGLGRDAAGLGRAEWARWRQQARAWLRADLATWGKTLDSGSDKDLVLARRMLTHWQVEPELAGIRDLNALDEASAEERDECFALWDEVGAVLRRIAMQEQAIKVDSKRAHSRRALRTELIQQGRLEEARVAWRAALAGNPLDHDDWFGYAELCLFLGQEDEYRRARRDLLARFFITADSYVAERTGRACLLLPASGDELRQAVALARRAAASDPSDHSRVFPWFLSARGLAEYREGKIDQAIATMRGDASRLDRPLARLVLAMALHRDGQVAEARRMLATAILSYDWRATQAVAPTAWVCHVLRREAEGLVLPDLPAFRRGEYRPRDHDERLALLAGQLASCEFQGLQGAAARLYSDALAAEPGLAEDVAAGTRHHAAHAAALAGCGQGQDADRLRDEERALRRRQALDWLRQDLTWYGHRLNDGDAMTIAQIRERLQLWQGDPDLAGVRARDALARLPDEERQRWERLWSDVDVLLRRVSASE